MTKNVELPSDVSQISLRRCTNARPCSEAEEGEKTEVCGWRFFDEVNFLADISEKSECNAGQASHLTGFACRSCGALQPDGIPPQVISQLDGIEICQR